MKEFPPGAAVRVAHDARIVGLEDPSNPYWYRVAYADGSQAVINVARITYFADQVKVLGCYPSAQPAVPVMSAKKAGKSQ